MDVLKAGKGNVDFNIIRDSLDGLDINEASKKLKDLKLNPQLSAEILRAANNGKLLRGSADEIADGIKNVGKSGDRLDDLSNIFKGIGKEASKLLKTLLTSPTTWLVAIPALAIALEDLFTVDYSEANEAFQKSAEVYNETKSNVESLNSELKTTKDRITELENLDKLSLAEKSELEELQSQNAELERKISLEEKLLEIQSTAASRDAKDAMTKGSHSVAQSVKFGDSTGESEFKGEVGKVTDVEAIKENIALIKEYENELPNLQKNVIDAKAKLANSEGLWEIFDKQSVKDAESELKDYEDSITTLYKDLDVRASNIKSQLDILELNPEENAEEIRILKEALNSINNIELTGIRKELSKIESFFDGSSGKNAIKEQLLDSSSSTRELEEELSRLGLTLDDIGIENIGFLYDYLKEVKEASKEATDSVQDYSSSVSDIEAASESADQDKNWSTVSEAYKEAKELLKEGKTGTDNFQSMASFLNPAKVKELAEEGGKYTADAYQKAFEEVKKTANRWFGEDETKSMENFVNDFKKEGLFDVTTDEMGLWDIETNFKTTAEAADKFGISIESVETMLEALGAYGYDFGDIMFSGDAISEYEAHLENIRNMSKNLDDSSLKDKLEAIIGDADTKDFENRIEELTPEIVADIKFEYDLAQIDLEIQKLRDRLSYAGYEDTSANAELMASNDYRSETWRTENTGIKKDSGYMALDDTISNMRQNLNGKSGEELANLQKQVMAAQELRTAFENAFDIAELNGEKIDWESYINSDEANQTLSSIAEDFNLTEEELEKIFGKDFNFNIDTSDAEAKIDKIISTSTGKQIVMSVDATTEQIEEQINNLENGDSILFTAEVDGESMDVIAKKDLNGEITYEAMLADGSVQELEQMKHQDGTVTYKKAGQENPAPRQTPVNYLMGGQADPVPKDADVNYTLKSQDDPKDRTAYVTYRTRGGGGAGQYLGTAHLLGTSSAEHPIPKYSTRALAMGSLKNTSWLKDDWKTAKDEVALTGELGRELVVSGNRWWTVGDNGAGFAHIPAGSVVFNHKQTEELLSNGYTNSRGKAHLEGTAYRLGNYNGTGHAKTETVKTSSKSTKKATKALDAIAQWFDWIEVRLDRLARDSENAEKAIERAVGLSKTLSATNKAITAVNKEQDAAEKGAARYLKAAQTVAKNTGLSASLQKKVQNGTIDISKYGETTQKKISEYQKYYEQYLSALDKVADLEDQAIELALSRLDKITEYYEAVNSVHESLIDANDAKLDYREAMGYSAVSSAQKELLQSSIDEAKAIRDNAYTNYTKYQSEFNSLLKSGVLKKDSVEYYDRLSEINDLKAAYYEASTAVLEHADALREIEYTKLQNAIDRFSRAFEKIDLQLELAESRNEKVDESLYQEQIGLNNEELIKQYELKVKKMAKQANYALDSERYKELAEEIADIDGEINGLLISNEELKDSIFELRFNPLEESVGSLRDVRAEFEDFKSLLNEEAFFDSETGALTSEGVAQIYLIEQSMISAKQEIADYTKGLEKLRQNYESGLISEKEFNEKNAEYREGIRDAISDVKDYGDALSDLYITQMEKENEVLQEVIDKRKEALQRKEDYYNYDKTIRNQTKDLNMLRAQAAALEGANDATSIVQLKKLRQEIADAEDELSETKRQHSVEMQETGYDELSQDLDDILADTTLEIKTNADKQLSIIDEMLTQTVNKYAQAYESINKIIAQTGFVGSEAFNESLSQLQSQTGAESQKDKATTSQSNTSATEPVQNIETDKIKDIDTSKIEESIQTPENTKNRPVVKITPSKTSVSVMEGKTTSISCTVLPSDAKNKNLSWKSSNKSIATVSNGKIKGVKAGSCTITIAASDGSGTKASVSVTVTSAPKKENSPTAKDLIIAPTTKPTTTTTATSSGGNGKITKGEKVTFASGKYTASSDGSGTTGKSRLGKSVYIAKVKSGATRPYLLSSDKAGKNLLGWVKKSQLKGYASGTKGTTQDEWARIYEEGNEIVTLPDGSVLTKLPRGTGVIPNNLTENLWGLAKSADDIMANTVGNAMKYINNVVNNGGNNITYHYDSLLTVEGNVDKDVLPRLEEILKKSYQYTSEHMYKDAVKLGFRKR